MSSSVKLFSSKFQTIVQTGAENYLTVLEKYSIVVVHSEIPGPDPDSCRV
jgi:hypothetical protein